MTEDSDDIWSQSKDQIKLYDPGRLLQSLTKFCEETSVENRTFVYYEKTWGPKNPAFKHARETFNKYFGSFHKAIQELGFDYDARAYTRISREDVLENLKEFCEAFPEEKRLRKNFLAWKGQRISIHGISLHFTSFSKAIRATGYSPAENKGRGPLNDDEKLEAFERICRWTFEQKQTRPARKDINEYNRLFADGIHYVTLRKRFGNYKLFVERFFLFKQGRLSKSALVSNKPISRKPLKTDLRFKILERDQYTCQTCGSKAPDVTLEIDHILPVSKGGTDTEENLRVLCQVCNNGRSNEYLD